MKPSGRQNKPQYIVKEWEHIITTLRQQYNETNNKNTTAKITKIWKLNNTLLNIQWIKDRITRKIRRYYEKNEKNKIY